MIYRLRIQGWFIRKRMEFQRWRLRRQINKYGKDSFIGTNASMLVNILTISINLQKNIKIVKPNPYRPHTDGETFRYPHEQHR